MAQSLLPKATVTQPGAKPARPRQQHGLGRGLLQCLSHRAHGPGGHGAALQLGQQLIAVHGGNAGG
ncbi:hypothetical protein BEN48_15065 [Hymenobacter glacialis]|uniref:Uncharacterized protein n=1 Tax=Hymenobacter glacialis TaxID=1908236 RepID=A0A1G1T2F1_9BACT|nr:hypothetical protein BEN48_15065 [Hymenobacter glacialis]